MFSRIPVYATTPVIALGRALLQDVYASSPLASAELPASALADFALSYGVTESADRPHILLTPPSADDISEYFNAINPLKFSQQHQPSPSPTSPPLDGLTITAHSAGHSLGGTIWHIQHGSESVVYAVDWNQARENVLAGAAWLGGSTAPGSEVIEQLRQPSALICSSKRCDVVGPEGGWKTRDETLLKHVRATLAQGGSVLIPCDSSSRVLELAFLLEKAWTDDAALSKTPLYTAGHAADAVMRYARSMLEWMDESIVREFEANAVNRTGAAAAKNVTPPFDFKFMKLVDKKSRVNRALSTAGPKVFLASDTSLEWGFSRQILENVSGQAGSMVIFPDHAPSPASQDGSVLDALRSQLGANDVVNEIDQTVSTFSVEVQPLEEGELPLYQQYMARQRERQTAVGVDRETAIETAAEALDDQSSSSSSSEDSDNELQGKALNTLATMTSSKQRLGVSDEELGVNILLRRKNMHDYDIRGKRGRERVFPYVAKRKRTDDFGDAIRPDEYLRAEEREDPAAAAQQEAKNASNKSLGQKRKFGLEEQLHDLSGKRQKTNHAPLKNGAGDKSAKTNGEHQEVEEEDSDYEPEEATFQGPRKAIMTKRDLHLKFRVTSVDYTGIHDQRSLNMLIPLIKPRKLVLTAGNVRETGLFKEECERLLAATGTGRASEILAPALLESVDASVDTNAWSIKLSPALLRTLHWQQVRQLGLATVSGRVEPLPAASEADSKLSETDDKTDAKRQKTANGVSTAATRASGSASTSTALAAAVLGALPAHLQATERTFAQSVHVGDVRLAELRKALQAARHTAEFKGEGTLLVDGAVTVRKTGIGRVEVECAGTQADAAFDAVKRRIYEGLAVVAAR